MNKTDRRWLDDLIADTARGLYEQAVAIYEELGPGAVDEWGHKIGLRFEFCEPCEAETPSIGSDCAVCGTIRADYSLDFDENREVDS